MAAKDLDISISGTTLTVSGEKQEQEEKKDENFYQCECRYGSFRRVIDLPETIDADKMTGGIGQRRGHDSRRQEARR